MVDLRCPDSAPPSSFFLRGAACAPASRLTDALLEFPPRGVPYFVLHDGSPLCLAALAKLSKLSVGADIRGAVNVGAGGDEPPWFWGAAPAGAVLRRAHWPLADRARLWRPGPLAALLAARARGWAGLPPGAPLAVLDVGAGSGRNSVFLAESCGGGGAVVAVDSRRDLCGRMARFAMREVGARGGRVACAGWDGAAAAAAAAASEAPARAEAAAPGALFVVCADAVELLRSCATHAAAQHGDGMPTAFDAVLFARFLHRGALALSALALRARGGVVCAETFFAAPAAGLPRENLLAEGELRECVRAGLAGSERRGWDVRTLHEGAAATEDGRALWSAAVWAGPPQGANGSVA